MIRICVCENNHFKKITENLFLGTVAAALFLRIKLKLLNRLFLFFFLLFSSYCNLLPAQLADTVNPIPQDSVTRNIRPGSSITTNDSLPEDTVGLKDSLKSILKDSTLYLIDSSLATADSIRKKAEQAKRFILTHKKFMGQEILFYALIAMLLFYASLRVLFPKYFTDLFRVYFRTTLNQTQVREQLLQNPLPSLFLNGFFIVTGGLYADFMILHFNLAPQLGFWELWLYCSFLLTVIYMIKFAGVKLAGWLFNKNEAATSYLFIVFMTNKILGILVLPFLALLAFGSQKIYISAVILSITIVSCILLYRSYLSIGVIRNQIRINPLHFFLYLFAFEIIPLLILFKLVMNFLK